MPPEKPDNQYLVFLHLGWMIVLALCLCLFGGIWLDKKFGTAPVLLLLSLFLAFFVCGYLVFRAAKK